MQSIRQSSYLNISFQLSAFFIQISLAVLLPLSTARAQEPACYQEKACRTYSTDYRVDPPKRIELRCIRILQQPIIRRPVGPTTIFGTNWSDKCYCVHPGIELTVPEGAKLIDDYGLLYPDGTGRQRICQGNTPGDEGTPRPPIVPPGVGPPILPPIDPPGNGRGTSDFNADSFT